MLATLKLTIAYDGTGFHGSQRQKNGRSVQEDLENAFFGLNGQVTDVVLAGRTDAGVHATGQVAHADLQRDWDPFRLSEALNWHLKPAPVAILAAARVADDFHARFSAQGRRYLFRLLSRRAPATHDRGRVWQVVHPLDVQAMREGAAHLVGRHDFTTFRSTMCQAASPVKTLDCIAIEEIAVPHGAEYRFYLSARSFLHNQVRSIVGTLERVGAGALAPDRVRNALEARDRAACGPVCPPQGLCLVGADYPADPFSGAASSRE